MPKKDWGTIPKGFETINADASERVLALLHRHRFVTGYLEQLRHGVDLYFTGAAHACLDAARRGTEDELLVMLRVEGDPDMAASIFDQFRADWFEWKTPEWLVTGLSVSLGLQVIFNYIEDTNEDTD